MPIGKKLADLGLDPGEEELEIELLCLRVFFRIIDSTHRKMGSLGIGHGQEPRSLMLGSLYLTLT